MDLNKFKHRTPIQIRFADVDSLKHVNNAHYLTYLESARCKYFDEVVNQPVEWTKRGIILAKATIDFLKPVLFNDRIEVLTRCSRTGNKSFDLEYLIASLSDGEKEEPVIYATATTIMVCFDYEKNETIVMPEEWKRMLEGFEK